MNTVDLDPIVFVYFLILLVPIFILNKRLGLKTNQKLLFAMGRMAVQLVLVGLFLQYLFDLNNTWLNLAYIALMMLVASFSAIRSCKLSLSKYFLPILIAMIIPSFLVMLFFNALLLDLGNVFDAQYMIAIQGMILGNTLSGIVIGVNLFYTNIKDDEKRYFQTLSLSCSRAETLRPYYRKTVMSTLSPVIASLETMGLVALPGMMTGQILGGTVPIVAIKYQIAIMLAILAARYFSVLLALWLTSFKAFDEYDVLSV